MRSSTHSSKCGEYTEEHCLHEKHSHFQSFTHTIRMWHSFAAHRNWRRSCGWVGESWSPSSSERSSHSTSHSGCLPSKLCHIIRDYCFNFKQISTALKCWTIFWKKKIWLWIYWFNWCHVYLMISIQSVVHVRYTVL